MQIREIQGRELQGLPVHGNKFIGTKVDLIFLKNLGKYENSNLCRRYQIYIYEGADALRCFSGCSQAAGLENDDDMWGINPLTRIYGTRTQFSICVKMIKSKISVFS